MDIRLKHRLIGSIVILALLVVFVPMLFSKHAREKIMGINTSTPAAPNKPQIVQNTNNAQIANQEVNVEKLQNGQNTTNDQSANEAQTHSTNPTINQTTVNDQSMTVTPVEANTSTESSNSPAISNNRTVPATVNQPAPIVTTPANQAAVNNAATVTTPTTTPPSVTTLPATTVPVAQNITPTALPVQSNQTKQPETVSTQSPAPTNTTASTDKEVTQLLQEARSVTKESNSTNESNANLNKQPSAKISEASVEVAKPLPIRVNTATSENVVKPTVHQEKQIAKATVHNQAWVVQLGTFANKSNAKKFITLLRKKGYAAFSDVTSKGQKVLTRVFVGPTVKKADALLLQKHLKNNMQLNSFVVSYDVTK